MKKYKKRSKRHGKYKSGLEAIVSKHLIKKGCKYESSTIQYVIPKKYKPDFTRVDANGHEWHIEVKGFFRYEDQQKMKAVKFSNPDLDIRMYFPKDGKVQGSNMTNSEWCKKYGYPYCIGRFPRGWFQ